jgi:hypothetical protein
LSSAPSDAGAATALISFLRALPDCRMRRGIRFSQWWVLLLAILAIYCFAEGCRLQEQGLARQHGA